MDKREVVLRFLKARFGVKCVVKRLTLPFLEI